jgi:dienelactone hydrolase
VAENVLTAGGAIWPLFLIDGLKKRLPVSAMPGVALSEPPMPPPAARTARLSYRVRWSSLFWLLSMLFPAAERARADGIRFDTLEIQATIGGPGAYRLALEAMVVRPDGQNPHPLAIINHGSPRDAGDRRRMSPFGMGPQAAAFARRGWTAVAFMRRGYGRSQGDWAESYGSCADPDYKDAGLAGAADILAVAKYMATQPYVLNGDWISVGVSAGAFATIALTSTSPRKLAAAIAFAPGRGSLTPDTVCAEDRLVDAMRQYGKSSKIPVLWISAENDHFFGSRLAEKLKNALTKAGAK